MRKILIVTIILLMGAVKNSCAENVPLQKLERGLTNVVTAPVEIPKEIRAHWIKGSEKTYHIIVWIFCGFVKGTAMTTARLGSGVWDVVTFPITVSKDNKPLLQPDYVFEEWPRREEGVEYKNLGDE